MRLNDKIKNEVSCTDYSKNERKLKIFIEKVVPTRYQLSLRFLFEKINDLMKKCFMLKAT